MIPQPALGAMYRSIAALFSLPRTSQSQHHSSRLMTFVPDLNADAHPENHQPLDHLTLFLTKNDPSFRTRPKLKLSTLKYKKKTARNVTSITPRSSKRKFSPWPPRKNWPPLPKLGAKELRDALYHFWYLLQAFPVNAANLESLFASNPGVTGVTVGASRLLPYLPIDSRRLKFANKPARPHSLDTYIDRELQNAPGSIKHISTKSVLGSIKYFYPFVEDSTLATIAYPTANMTADDTQAALSILLHTCRTHYQVRPKVISTDSATNLNPVVLNHRKTQEDLTFTVLGRGRARFTSPLSALSIAVHIFASIGMKIYLARLFVPSRSLLRCSSCLLMHILPL